MARLRIQVLLLSLCLALCVPLALQADPAESVPSTGKTHPQLAPFDRMMRDFLGKYPLPGAALAVAHHGQVVYERGFGYADVEKEELVRPDALFRIASISKPLTAVAILQLVEKGKLKLSDHVFDVLDLKPSRAPDAAFDERWRKVTILHLLHHAGGWDRSKAFDPMFHSPAICKELNLEPPAGPEAIIRYMLREPLQFDPGERYVYSNFGYCLLGRVVAKVSGQSYEDYVRQQVLAPLGIRTMRIGHTLLRERAPGEVHYYTPKNQTAPAILGPDLGKPVPIPYGAWYLEAMDSHGGWIASAGDLVRFAAALQDPETCKILNPRSLQQLFAVPVGKLGHRPDGKVKESFYACGWQVQPEGEGKFNFWHNGSLDGTSSLLVGRSDGLTWAVLFNSRAKLDKAEPAVAIDPLIHKAADAVKTWPRR
jgi:N-acyl-D-amino-acid deacylase